MWGSLQLPASALTFFGDVKLPTGCSLSVLHYRPNAASPVPTALRSFSTFLPCSSPHLTQDSPFPVKRHIVPSHPWDIDWSKVRVCAVMPAWVPRRYCLTRKSQGVQGLTVRGMRCLFTFRGGNFHQCWPDARRRCALTWGTFFCPLTQNLVSIHTWNDDRLCIIFKCPILCKIIFTNIICASSLSFNSKNENSPSFMSHFYCPLRKPPCF